MKVLIQTIVVSCTFLFAQTSVANSDAYVCLYGNSERTIKVVYSNPDSKVPCEVVYEKNTGSQVLWNAQNMEGYCETKAQEFVEKQRGWGWDCAQMGAAQSDTTEATPAQ